MTDMHVEAIENNDSLDAEEKAQRLMRLITNLRSKSLDDTMALESQDGHALIEAERALARVSASD